MLHYHDWYFNYSLNLYVQFVSHTMFWYMFLKLCYSYALLFFFLTSPKTTNIKKWISSKNSWLNLSRNYWNCQTRAKGRRPTRTSIFLSASSGLLKGEQEVKGKKLLPGVCHRCTDKKLHTGLQGHNLS